METNTNSLSEEEAEVKIKECTSFIDNTLKKQLEISTHEVTTVQNDINEYKELRTKVIEYFNNYEQQQTDDPFVVDLGYQLAYCDAVIDKEKQLSIFTHVGMGFHIEFITKKEALQCLDKRVNFLSSEVLPKCKERLKNVTVDLEAANYFLNSLKAELEY